MSYPVDVRLEAPPEVANWRPLVHWILGIPHLFIANVLQNVASVLALVSWFVILFTGRLPEGIARFQTMILRYEGRTYSYVLWLREAYPPFEFADAAHDPGTDPLRVDVEPQLEDRNRLTVGLRFLWIIPAAIFAFVVFVVAFVLAIVGFFAVLFTGRWPDGLRTFLVGSLRVMTRLNAYGRLVVDDYPPYTLGEAPAAAGAVPAT